MKNVLLAIGCFFLGFAGIIGLRYMQRKTFPPFVPVATMFRLTPPANAGSGTIIETQGKIKLLRRGADEFSEASRGAKIVQGETLATEYKTRTRVNIDRIADLTLDASTEITFDNLVPESFVLVQKSGSVDYELTGSAHPVSIRALHSLISIASGASSVRVGNASVTVAVRHGSSKLAIVDTDNNTRVYDVVSGQTLFVNDSLRTVKFLEQ